MVANKEMLRLLHALVKSLVSAGDSEGIHLLYAKKIKRE